VRFAQIGLKLLLCYSYGRIYLELLTVAPTQKKKGRAKKANPAAHVEAEVEVLPSEEAEFEDSLPDEAEALEVEDLSDLEEEFKTTTKEKTSKRKSKSSGAVVSYDPLKAYLAEISQYPKLSREEERDLAISYLEKGDLNAAYKLTVANLWLVVAIARRYQRAARSLLDLIQEGNIGLMEAVKNFDPYKEVRFPSYATWWIKAYIVRFVIANWRLVKLGTTQAQRKLFFNLEKEKTKLEKQGFVPDSKLLASSLNVKESEVIEMQQRLGGADISVDAPVGGDESTTLHSILAADALNAEDTLAADQVRQRLFEAMNEFSNDLNEKEKVIYEKRLLSEEKATLQEIADEFSISKERVRQLENRIKSKLKKYLEEKLGEAFLMSDLGLG